jgi:membrane dipeptidase
MDRRAALRLTLGAAGGVVAAPMINLGRYQLFAHDVTEYSERAIRLVKESTVIDMLSPFAVSQAQMMKELQDPDSWDAARLQAYQDSSINVFHIAVGTGGPDAYQQTHMFVASWNGFIAAHDQHLMRIDSVADLERVKSSGKIGVIIGVQNSEHFRRLDDIDYYFALGQRVSQLTYNARNMIGNGSTERRDDGLSDFGVSVVERMNKLGMAVDVSHSGDRTTIDACDVSTKPVLFTHSNSRVLSGGHPRTKTDEAITKMAATGGVMGITAVRMFVKKEEPTTVEDVLNHFDHVRDLVGPEHLGVGSDIDLYGYDKMPPEENERLRAAYKGSYAFRDKIDIEGLDHPKRMFDLTEGLIRRKYSDDDIRGVLGGNFQRVLSAIWTVPKEEKKATSPGLP